MLYVRLTIKVKVGIPESFKVGWYPHKITGLSHLKIPKFDAFGTEIRYLLEQILNYFRLPKPNFKNKKINNVICSVEY